MAYKIIRTAVMLSMTAICSFGVYLILVDAYAYWFLIEPVADKFWAPIIIWWAIDTPLFCYFGFKEGWLK